MDRDKAAWMVGDVADWLSLVKMKLNPFWNREDAHAWEANHGSLYQACEMELKLDYIDGKREVSVYLCNDELGLEITTVERMKEFNSREDVINLVKKAYEKHFKAVESEIDELKYLLEHVENDAIGISNSLNNMLQDIENEG